MRAALRLHGLHHSYGATAVLRGVDLALTLGTCTALIGPNGAGKTTLFDIVCGLTRPDAGQVEVLGRHTLGWPTWRVQRLGLARTQQHGAAGLGLRLRQALCGAYWLAHGRGSAWWRWSNDAHRAHAAVQKVAQAWGLADVLDEPIEALPYGDLRRFELAWVAMADPRLVLLDEPTAGLSRSAALALVNQIKAWAQGRAVLLIEHDMDVVMGLADRVAVLHDGVIVAEGLAAEVQANAQVRATYAAGWPQTGVGDA